MQRPVYQIVRRHDSRTANPGQPPRRVNRNKATHTVSYKKDVVSVNMILCRCFFPVCPFCHTNGIINSPGKRIVALASPTAAIEKADDYDARTPQALRNIKRSGKSGKTVQQYNARIRLVVFAGRNQYRPVHLRPAVGKYHRFQ